MATDLYVGGPPFDGSRSSTQRQASRSSLGSQSSQGSQGRTRLKKKPQTCSPPQRKLTKRPGSTASSIDESTENKPVAAKLPVSQAQARPSPQRPLLVSGGAPDLSDSKWAAYLSPAQSQESFSLSGDDINRDASPIQVAPELLSEPNLPVTPHAGSAEPLRASMDDSIHMPSDPVSFLTRATLARRAKTPVFAVGQLEQARIDRVDVLAEDYRALLQPRDSLLTDSRSEPPPSPRDIPDSPPPPRRQCSTDGLMCADGFIVGDMNDDIPPANSSPLSATSDDTLVSFEEETIYFKPMSFTPETPLSPIFQDLHHDFLPGLGSPLQSPTRSSMCHASSTSTPSTEDPASLSLQICMDLLIRELSFAASGGQRRASYRPSGAGVSSLQIWVMIEAYERLRDDLLGHYPAKGPSGEHATHLPTEELRSPVEMMLDVWLRALYAIHDSLTEAEVRAGEVGPAKVGAIEFDATVLSEELD